MTGFGRAGKTGAIQAMVSVETLRYWARYYGKMRRWGLTLVTYSSLLFCAMGCALRWLSYHSLAELNYRKVDGTEHHLTNGNGLIDWRRYRSPEASATSSPSHSTPYGFSYAFLWYEQGQLAVNWSADPQFAGFGFELMGYGNFAVSVPHMLFIVGFGLLPSIRVVRWAQRKFGGVPWMARARSCITLIAASLSMLTAIALICLWVHSYWHRGFRIFSVYHEHEKLAQLTQYEFEWGRGGIRHYRLARTGVTAERRESLRYAHEHPHEPWPSLPAYPIAWENRGYSGPPIWRDPVAGFLFQDIDWDPTDARRQIIMPIWSLVVLTLIVPGLWVYHYTRKRRLRNRLKHGLCVNCGYDLRASPQRCPECGHVAKGESWA